MFPCCRPSGRPYALIRLLVALVLLFGAILCAHADEADGKRIARLVGDLASEDLATRQAAMRDLGKIGEPAVAALRQATKVGDPDVRLRAHVVLRAIDRAQGPEDLVLTGHTADLVCLDLSRDGKKVLSGGNDGTARLWDLDTGKEVRRVQGMPGKVWAVAFAPDGRSALVGCSKGTLGVFDVGTGQLTRAFPKQTKAVRCVCFLPDGKRAVTANYDRFVRLLDVNDAKELQQLSGHASGQLSLACSADGKLALSGGGQKEKVAILWDLQTGKSRHHLGGHGERIIGTAFSPDGKYAATACWDQKAYLWDVASGKQERTLACATKVYAVAFSPDNRLLATGEDSGKIILWEVATGKAVQSLEGHTSAANLLRFAPDGRTLISGSKDRTVRTWRLKR